MGAGVSAVERTRRRIGLNPVDWAAVEHVRTRHSIYSFIEALRTCVLQQRLRDQVCGSRYGAAAVTGLASLKALMIGGPPDTRRYESITGSVLPTVVPILGKPPADDGEPRPAVGNLRYFVALFWADDEAAINQIMTDWKIDTTMGAVRFCVRVQATLNGYVPEGGVW